MLTKEHWYFHIKIGINIYRIKYFDKQIIINIIISYYCFNPP